MTTIKEIHLQSVAEPFSVKIERGQKGGYGYELGAKCESIDEVISSIKTMREEIEKELYGDANDGKIT